MNRKKFTPYLLIGLVLLLFVLAELFIPKPLDWTVSLSAKDKKPYGAYGLWQVLPHLFPEQEIQNLHLTLYEIDSLADQHNLLVMAENLSPDEQDTRVLLEKVAGGDRAFLAASNFGGPLADSLQIQMGNLLFERLATSDKQWQKDSITIRFEHTAKGEKGFAYTLASVPAFFDSLPAESRIWARNHLQEPVLVSRPWGKGEIFLSSTPLAFSNYYLLEGENHHFIERALSLLPPEPLIWTEYYQLGRMEAQTPLRFILSDPALRWAYYFGMSILLLFILFSIKRRQRPIPSMPPPQNTSLQFAASIGNLYFQQGAHRQLARKKVVYLNDFIRRHYRLDAAWHEQEFPARLAQKSNKALEKVKELQQKIQQVEEAREYPPEKLIELHESIRWFYRI